MTLTELRELLSDLPASAETAPVVVNEMKLDIRRVSYERGTVYVTVPGLGRCEDCEADDE